MNAWGEVAFDRTMCSAVRRRMFENGTTWSPARRNEAMETGGAGGALTTGVAGAAGGAGAAGAGGRGGAGVGDGPPSSAADRRDSTTRSTSVAGDAPARPGPGRPPTRDAVLGEEPAHDRRERPGARRRRRWPPRPARVRTGTRRPEPRPVAVAEAVAAAGGGAAPAGGAGAAVGGRRPVRPRRRAAPAPSPITASRTPTSTVSPSGTRISVRTPAAGEGTSESTLSVETSKSGSSRSTWSPTRLHPAGDRALGHRLAELRHRHVSQRADPFRSAPASSRRRSRTATGAAG